jgi:hypothetical protein
MFQVRVIIPCTLIYHTLVLVLDFHFDEYTRDTAHSAILMNTHVRETAHSVFVLGLCFTWSFLYMVSENSCRYGFFWDSVSTHGLELYKCT